MMMSPRMRTVPQSAIHATVVGSSHGGVQLAVFGGEESNRGVPMVA